MGANAQEIFSKISSKFSMKWLYFLSLPAAAALFFIPQGYWGAMDEGQFLYEERAGYMSWLEHLFAIFFPLDKKVFLFGTFRPLPYGLYFKLLSSFGMGIDGYRYVSWVGSWLSCLIFSWGLYVLVKRAFSLRKDSIWLIAFMVWWTPTWLLCSHLIYPDCWMQPALMGLFWGLYFGEKEDLPSIFRSPLLRYTAGSLALFLAFQTHETTLFLLLWTYFWIGLDRFSELKKNRYLLLPLLVGLAYLIFYRSLDSTLSNRPEISISYQPSDLIFTAVYYFFISLNGISQTIFETFGLRSEVVGVISSESSIAFVLTLSGLVWLAWLEFTGLNNKWKISLFLLLGGVFCTCPYLVMHNRSLAYYGIKLQMFLAAWVAMIGILARDLFKIRLYGLGLCLFWVGGLIGTFTVMDKNWAKTYGGKSMAIHKQILEAEGIDRCTPDSPCCLKFSRREWIYNEYTVNWNDGASLKPRFVGPQGNCKYTYDIDTSGGKSN